MASSEELGTLICVVLKAQNLNDKHSFYKQDVFAQITMNGVTHKTKVDVKGGQHPQWDEEFRWKIPTDPSSKTRKLEVSCWSKEPKPKSDDLLGQATVDIEETLRTGEFDEWVKLDVNGVSRGEIYLEMTFYSNAPRPQYSLVAPKNTALERRPSKLNPSERLWRPPQRPTPPTSSSPPRRDAYFEGQTHLVPAAASASSSRSSSASRGGRDSPLPPLPSDAPASLQPARNKPQAPVQPLPSVPAILKPGHGQRQPTSHSRQSSGSPDPTSFAPAPIPYNSQPNQNPYPGAVSYQPPPAQGNWSVDNSASAPLSFPVPQVAPPPANPGPFHYNNGPGYPGSYSSAPPPGGKNDDLPDPYLLARYQSPLPLPPGSSPPSRGRQPLPPNQNPEANARAQAQRLAEAEARRRKEQEEKDLELARQLDQELNVDASTPTTNGRHMPGGW